MIVVVYDDSDTVMASIEVESNLEADNLKAMLPDGWYGEDRDGEGKKDRAPRGISTAEARKKALAFIQRGSY